jgi:Uncharacterised nucleotidyltransferase
LNRRLALGPDERRLLMTCARTELEDDESAELDTLLRRSLDWEAVVFFARLHSVGPLLHRHLREREDIPREARRELLKQYQRTAYQNRIFAREHAELVDTFVAADVPILVQKGLSIAELAYGNLASRPLIDLMYLVHPPDVVRVADALQTRGFTPTPHGPRQGLYRWSCPQFLFRRTSEDLALAVLVQPTLVSWPRFHRFDSERVWSEARPAWVGGREVLVLSPVDLVLYLCLQADNHGFFNRAAIATVDPGDLLFAEWSNDRLVRFVDIRESIRLYAGEIDWGLLAKRARHAMIAEAVHASLLLTNRLLGVTAPEEVIKTLEPAQRPRVRTWLLQALVGDQRVQPAQRLAASVWKGAGPRRQIDLAYLLGLAELALPNPRSMDSEDSSRSTGSRLGRYAQHTGHALARSSSGLLQASVGRARSRLLGDGEAG